MSGAKLNSSALLDPWQDGLSNIEHLMECDGCDRCDYLMNELYMACDECGEWGQQNSDGWFKMTGMVFCSAQCEKNFWSNGGVLLRRAVEGADDDFETEKDTEKP